MKMDNQIVKEVIEQKINNYRENTLNKVLHLVTAGTPEDSKVLQRNMYINALSYAVQNALSNSALTTEQRLEYVIQNLAIGQDFAETLLAEILAKDKKQDTVN